MPGRLPPLNSLRFFEAAARHLSFTLAARELHVTQAAVSQQIRSLEGHLGVPLFRRLTRQLLLTDEGQILLPVVHRCLEQLSETFERLSPDTEGGTLTVMLRPFFASRWLSTRLGRFWSRHPNVELRLHHSTDPSDFVREDVDMAVRWGRGEWPGVQVELLLPTTTTPVCSPALLEGPKAIRAPSDLCHHTLLHEEDYDTWSRWLAAAGAPEVNARRGLIIDDTNVRTQAAIDGQGVALAPVSLLADDIATGRLAAPFPVTLDDLAYYLIYPPNALEHANARAFRDWLLDEAAESTE